MKYVILLLCMLYFLSNSAAQIELAGIRYSNFAKASLTDATNNQEVSFHEFSAFFNLPTPLKNGKTTLINGMRYGLVQSNLYNAPLFNRDKATQNLHSIAYTFTALHKLNDNWNLLLQLKPTIASDLKDDLGDDDFLFLGMTMATRKIGEHMVLGAGMVYTTQTGIPLLLPVLKFKHKGDNHIFDVLLPSHVRYLQQIGTSNKYYIGPQVSLNGGNYNINLSQFGNPELAPINKLRYSRTNVGLLTSLKIHKFIKLELFGGFSMQRSYTFDAREENLYYGSDEGAFLSIGLSMVPEANQ